MANIHNINESFQPFRAQFGGIQHIPRCSHHPTHPQNVPSFQTETLPLSPPHSCHTLCPLTYCPGPPRDHTVRHQVRRAHCWPPGPPLAPSRGSVRACGTLLTAYIYISFLADASHIREGAFCLCPALCADTQTMAALLSQPRNPGPGAGELHCLASLGSCQ